MSEDIIYQMSIIDGIFPSGGSETENGQAALMIHIYEQYSAIVKPREACAKMKRKSRLSYSSFEIDDAYTLGHSAPFASGAVKPKH